MRSLFSRTSSRHRSMPEDFVRGPVFYDRTGKRLYYFLVSVCVISLIFAVLPARVTPLTFDPVWQVPTNGDNGYPRRLLSTLDQQHIPILGSGDGEIFARVVRV